MRTVLAVRYANVSRKESARNEVAGIIELPFFFDRWNAAAAVVAGGGSYSIRPALSSAIVPEASSDA
jgi:hypothetical protein